MSQNLKARLLRIRNSGGKAAHDKPDSGNGNAAISEIVPPKAIDGGENAWPGWTEICYKTLKRKLYHELPFSLSPSLPKALAILIPDILRLGRIPLPEELLFFDLETTGLSGGAGTIAFLAAFGRFLSPKQNDTNAYLEITQYLLLDYPGEPDFMEKAMMEFAGSPVPVAVSYNGKCYDSQILKNRCLMNGMAPPDYFHADLLHPARRLWKRKLPDCSQSTIEVSVLGLDRTGDVPGAMAPDIWFSFLRNGINRELLSICDHNLRDIAGLASLFLALAEIAAEPFESPIKYRFDEEGLALSWIKAINKNPSVFGREEKKAGELLLETAAKNGHPAAATAMAIRAEWRLKDPVLALTYTQSALENTEISERLREELEKRKERLMKKRKEE